MTLTKTIKRSSFDNFVSSIIAGHLDLNHESTGFYRRSGQSKTPIQYSDVLKNKLNKLYHGANVAMRMAAVCQEALATLDAEEFKDINRNKFDIQDVIRQYCWTQYLSKAQLDQASNTIVLQQRIDEEAFKRAVFSQFLRHCFQKYLDENGQISADRLEYFGHFYKALLETINKNCHADSRSEDDFTAFAERSVRFNQGVNVKKHFSTEKNT